MGNVTCSILVHIDTNVMPIQTEDNMTDICNVTAIFVELYMPIT